MIQIYVGERVYYSLIHSSTPVLLLNSPSCTATHMYQHARDSFYTAARPA